MNELEIAQLVIITLSAIMIGKALCVDGWMLTFKKIVLTAAAVFTASLAMVILEAIKGVQ